MSLDRALHRLLHRRDAREALARGDLAGLGVDGLERLLDEDRDALRTIDLAHLESAAAVVRDAVFSRSHRGTGTLLDAYPRTIQRWRDANRGASLDILAEAFLASPAHDGHRALPTGHGGCSLEEAFFCFAEATPFGDATERLLEFAHAIVRALVVTPSPTFSLPSFVRRAPRGFFAVVGPAPTLIAALDRRLVTGPISPFLAALLARDLETTSEETSAAAARFGVSAGEARASEDELRRLGLA